VYTGDELLQEAVMSCYKVPVWSQNLLKVTEKNNEVYQSG
jgi:hypothetical protein